MSPGTPSCSPHSSSRCHECASHPWGCLQTRACRNWLQQHFPHEPLQLMQYSPSWFSTFHLKADKPKADDAVPDILRITREENTTDVWSALEPVHTICSTTPHAITSAGSHMTVVRKAVKANTCCAACVHDCAQIISRRWHCIMWVCCPQLQKLIPGQ